MTRTAALSLAFWVLLTGLLAGMAYLALDACALGLPGMPAVFERCPVEPAPAPTVLVDERREEEALRREIVLLERQLATAPDCRQPEPEVPEPETVEPQPEPQPAPDISEESWEEQDVSLLEGCWNLTSDYRLTDIDTGEIVGARAWQMCFEADGSGWQTLVLDNGVTCNAPVRGEFEGDQLVINDLDDVHCDSGFYIFRRVARCNRLANGTAACHSSQPGRGGGSNFTLSR